MSRRAHTFLFLMAVIFATIGSWAPSWGEEPSAPLEEVDVYFPAEKGSRWSYYGSIIDKIQRVSSYNNVTTISGTAEKEGIRVKVFSETNQANKGPAESYFVINDSGITYYGSSPTSSFEKQIVPYKIIPFPIYLNTSYRQLNKRRLSFGQDIDEDGEEEKVDVVAKMNAVGLETVSVPAGVFHGCLKLKGVMQLYITLSGSDEVVLMVDTITNWFAPGVGLVKWVERTDFPSVNGLQPKSIMITEELESFALQEPSLH